MHFYFAFVALNIILLKSGFQLTESSSISKAWSRALKQTIYEQEVEDTNAVHKIDNHLARRLIVMPLTEAFKPNQADLMHEKIQYGDKCSLPSSIGRLIFEKRYDVPWIFELVPVRKETDENLSKTCENTEESSDFKSELQKAYISPLDFRSPENYIFLPQWMMKCLRLKPNDLVDISFVRIKLAELVVFQPLSLAWDELMSKSIDPKAILEHEINKYSSLTAGSTIYIAIKGIEYPLFVKKTIAEGGVSVEGVRVQDSDIRTDIDRSILDGMLKAAEESEEN